MRTSKIIFISFFSIVVLFLLSLIIQTKPENRRGNKELREMKHEAIALPKISHLVLHGGCHLTLTGGASDSIKFGYSQNVQLVKPFYFIKGDTLIVNPFPNNESYYNEIFCSQLKTITIDSSNLDIKMIAFPDLTIIGKNCFIYCYENVSIDSAIIDMKENSNLSYHNSRLKSVQIILDKSKAEFYNNRIDDLKADLLNNSELSVDKVLHSDVKSDESSQFYSR